MDHTRIISDLRSDRNHIEQSILSAERSDRLSTGIGKAAANSATEIRRIGKPETRIVSELRSERDHIGQAILSLQRFDGLSTKTPEAAAPYVTEIRRVRKPDDGSSCGAGPVQVEWEIEDEEDTRGAK